MFKALIKKSIFSAAVLLFGVFLPVLAMGQTVSMNLHYDGADHAYSAEEVKIYVNGEHLTGMDMPPVIINDLTLMPARAVFEQTGANIVWNAESREVYIVQGSNVVVLKIDNTTGIKNGEEFTMDVPPKIINDRTMIPVRFAAEAMGFEVGWDDGTRTVSVTEPGAAVEDPAAGAPSETPVLGEINITSVAVPQSLASEQNFVISASGSIEKYEAFVLTENRLVVDIYNANNKIMNANIAVSTSPYVTAIRSAQNQMDPVKIARVVFDLSSSAEYEVKESSDKKSLTVSFSVNYINDLSFSSSGGTDVIKISGDVAPAVTVSTLFNPNSLAIDISGAVSKLKSSYDVSGDFVTGIDTRQMTAKSVRIDAALEGLVDYKVTQSGNVTTITITKSTLSNLSFASAESTLMLEKKSGLNIDSIVHYDDYTNHLYSLTLPGDYSAVYGYGTLQINNGKINNVNIKNSGGSTVIIFGEATIMAYEVTEDSEYIYIAAKNPKEVYDRIVVLDAGHGAADPGASGNGIVEKEMNLDLMLRVYQKLMANNGIKVYATRVADTYPQNKDRAALGNEVGDLFISIHLNSSTGADPSGTETLYMNHNNEKAGNLTSKIAAKFIQEYLVNALGTNSRGIKERPDLIVLNQTTVPAVLIEVLFLSNQGDAAIILDETNREKAGEAIYCAIVDMLGQYPVR